MTAADAAGISTDGAGACPTATTAHIATMAGISPITTGNGAARTIATGVIMTAVTGGDGRSDRLIDGAEILSELLPPPNVEGRRHRRRLR